MVKPSLLAFCTLFSLCLNFTAHGESLRQQLEEKSSASKADPKRQKIMEAAIADLRKAKLEARAKKVGQPFPDFTLKNSKGDERSLKALLQQGPVIVTFYRGSWCPYCAIQLAEYQKHLSAWEKKGARLVALSPELPELSRVFAQKQGLTFDLLVDEGNAVAKKAGLVFGVKGDLRKLYGEFGLDLAKSQGNPSWELPVAATYVVGQDGKVKYAFVDVDYKKRAEPSEIEAALAGKK